jgi:transcriptional regulator with XRE-family HTH domain
MQLVSDKVRRVCLKRGVRLKDALRESGVSRTAYYSLLRKESVLPRSLLKLAKRLDASPLEFLEDGTHQERDAAQLIGDVERICRRHPECDPDNVRHTLLMLKMKPWDRLGRALIRARKLDLH